MIHLIREEEPEFWREFRAKNPGIHYDDLQKTPDGRMVRNRLREFNINQQYGLCAYCCRQIDNENSLNEHIKPRGLGEYSNLSMEYTNIIASCKAEGADVTCSASKENKYDEMFISPLDEDCEKFFEFYENGEIVSDSPRGQYTINLLNLNSYKLCRARRAQLKACNSFRDPDLVRSIYLKPDDNHRLQPYADIVKCFYGR